MKFFVLVVILFLNCNILAQENREKIDSEISRLTKLEKKTDKTEKDIDEMLSLCKNIYSIEPDLMLDYLEKLKPVIETKKYYHGWDDYSSLILDIYRGKGHLQEAEKQIRKIYDRYADKFTLEDKVSVRTDIVQVLVFSEQTELSQKVIEEILPLAQTNSQKATLYYLRAANYTNEGNYKQATADCLTAIDLHKSVNDHKNISICYEVLANIYKNIGDYEKALAYAKEGLKWAKKSNQYLSEMNLYNSIGVSFRALKQIDSTLYYYNRSIELAKKYNRLENIAQNLMNMANIYSEEQKDYVRAEKYYKQSLDICYQSNIIYGIYINWSNLGNNYKLKKEYAQAKTAYDSASVYAERLKITSEKASVQKEYYELYKDKGDFRQALLHYEKYNKITGNLNLEEQKKEIAELQTKYDVAVKDREIERISNEYRIQKFRNGILLLIILGAGSVIYFLVYRNRSLRKLYQRNVELSNSPLLYEIPEDTEEADSLEKIFRELIHLMQNEKIYIEPNLSVDHIAKKLNTNQKYLSNSITKYADMNFNNFINSYRIHEAKRMMLRQPKLPIKEVMYVCGFNSKTPFYLAFQKYTGLSPQQFKDLSVSQNKKQAKEELIEA
jgi:AraC-like DNA-binding protein